LLIEVSFESVTNYKRFFGYFACGKQASYQRNIKGGTGFDMYVVRKCLVEDKAEMGGFGTIALGILSLIIMRLYGIVKKCLGILDILGDLRQVAKLQRRSVSINDLHQVYPVKMKFVLLYGEFFRWKIEGLLDKINVLVHVAHLVLIDGIKYSGQNLH